MSFKFYFPEIEQPKRPVAKPSVIVQLTTPEGRDAKEGDCAIRALAGFLEVPYAEAKELIIAEVGYSPRTGVMQYSYERLLLQLGLKFVPAVVRISSKGAKARLPKKAILLFKKHVVAYEDGVIYDTWITTSRAGCKQTKGYWTYA